MQRQLMWLLLIPIFCFLLQSCDHKKDHTVHLNYANSLINREIGDLFMVRNKLKQGIVTLPSGLQYTVIRPGIGNSPKLNDLVTVFYSGRYIDGTVFDEQHYQSTPITIRVSSTIAGWQQALQLMQPGSIWVLFVPPNLAYGEKGMPPVVGQNQTLIYTVHLLDAKSKPSD
jgi:FKBP-type peptidyl-prolyl cis-trans isomerase FklB